MALKAYALCTLARCKRHIGISEADTSNDELLTDLINEATDAIETRCNRRFLLTSYSEWVDGEGDDELFLKNFPIISVSSLVDGETTLTERESVTDDGFVVYDEEGYIWNDSGFSQGHKNISISYVAGYASDSYPEDLVKGAVLLVSHWYNVRGAEGIEAERTPGGYSVQYAKDIDDIPSEILSLVIPYKRFAIA